MDVVIHVASFKISFIHALTLLKSGIHYTTFAPIYSLDKSVLVDKS